MLLVGKQNRKARMSRTRCYIGDKAGDTCVKLNLQGPGSWESSIQIWLRSAHWLERTNIRGDRRTNGRMDG